MSEKSKPTCGIVMPISEIDGCAEGHWGDVLTIITEVIEAAGFSANLVSNADDVGVIQKRIIQNLYDNEIVVCDVSGKNPNVMFELGMRLAFDKPTIVIKDDKTAFSFDTSPLEHLGYPRDLRYSKIQDFRKILSEKIKNTYKKSKEDQEYTTFLKHFGSFKVAKLETTEVSREDFIIEELKSINDRISSLRSTRPYNQHHAYADWEPDFDLDDGTMDICLFGDNEEAIMSAKEILKNNKNVESWKIESNGDHDHISVTMKTKQKSSARILSKAIAEAMKKANGYELN